jgi:hypothetical protein
VRWLVMGDPQASFDQVMGVLARNGALAGDRVAPDVHLISVGDHFDYDGEDASRAGLAVLRWLAGHDPAQVTILFGNHDAARVMELIAVSDAEFAAAQALARTFTGTREERDRREKAEFLPRFPAIATAGLAAKDYASYTTEQRALVIELLLAGRFRLALDVGLAGHRALVTHAGITTRELAILDVPADPAKLAAALDARLAAAVDAVRADWPGVLTPLSLEPLHVAGRTGEEGGGLLYHRPSAQLGAWEQDARFPRRFDPRTLPLGLVQIAGHTGHHKCVAQLGDWVDDAARARARGGIRTLTHDAGQVAYRLGVHVVDGAGTLVLVDGEMRHDTDRYELLEVAP